MKYFAAILVAVVLVGLMFLFQVYMGRQMAAWEEANTRLNGIQLLLCLAADLFAMYWYLLAPCVVAVCLGFAALLPTRGRPAMP